MKPKNELFTRQDKDRTSCYDVEPRTGKPFASIKVQDLDTRKGTNIGGGWSLDTQVPYTNPRKEFDQSTTSGNKLGDSANKNDVEELNNAVNERGGINVSDPSFRHPNR